ncbi:TPA: hypothetical protein ACT96X_003076 [Legionella pneumophila]|uniref:hypothetical protein n=1 Tax=Legionella pneumophila TaxID=446 RepID=UPI000788AC6F|nr:hypothetical protein [Legionella pneumophila]HAU1192565.1 hypothetical protein [Legionella pneumophila]HAU1639535.1 hypothetical protein [Legionella pneumophila]HBD7103142.1 hypothetical protein [Legionella pneumophila]HCO4739654.1 hypothetical protein [Legionella pneumophila]HDU7930508.1 hypothetical protein [Legionella pneumophila]
MKNILKFFVLSFAAINSYAALNIPMPDAPDVALGNSLSAGRDLYNQRANQEFARAQNERENELHQLQIEIMEEELRQLKNQR